jgi:hypothetical protein
MELNQRNEITLWTIVWVVFIGSFAGIYNLDHDTHSILAQGCFCLWLISGAMLYARFPTFRYIVNVIVVVMVAMFLADQFKKRNEKR